MTWIWPAALLGLLLATTGCSTGQDSASQPIEAAPLTTSTSTTTPSTSNDATSVGEALDQARVRWSEVGPTHYRLTVTEHLNYWSNGCTWSSVVSDGVVTETDITPASCIGAGWTVEQLHLMVAEMVSELDQFAAPVFGHHRLEVTFDANGVPQSIGFDLANAVDEERSMEITFAGQTPSVDTSEASGEPDRTAAEDDLPKPEGEWLVEELRVDGVPIELDRSWPVTVVVEGDTISGVAACNHYRGAIDWTYQAGWGTFVVSELSWTAKACEEPAMTIEQAFLAALQVADSYEAADGLYVAGVEPATNFRLVRPDGSG